MFVLAVVMIALFDGGHSAAGRQHKTDFLLDGASDETHDSEPILDTKHTAFYKSSPGFFPSSLADPIKLQDFDSLDLQKRISRLIVNPHTKRWSEMFRVPPDAFREMRNGGFRVRPFLRRDYVGGGGGGFRMSYAPGKKRPSYYAEPEGSEFLGGPGK